MGTSWGARLVVGVRLESLYTEEFVTDKRTKYNPDTGAPYEVSVQVLKSKFLENPLPDILGKKESSYSDRLKYYRDFSFIEKIDGLNIYFPWYPGEAQSSAITKEGIVGVVLEKEAWQDRWTVEIPTDTITKAIADVKEKLEKAGYKGEVTCFVQMTVG